MVKAALLSLVIVIYTAAVGTAHAQVSTAPEVWQCNISSGTPWIDGHSVLTRYVTPTFKPTSSDSNYRQKMEEKFLGLVNERGFQRIVGSTYANSVFNNLYCGPVSEPYISTIYIRGTYTDYDIRMLPNIPSDFGDLSPLVGPIETTTIQYVDRDGRGYGHGAIQLQYRFLICADELQIAYSLLPNTTESSDDYFFEGSRYPISQAAGPQAVTHFRAQFFLVAYGNPVGAEVNDHNAGEALGMGCFTGQTHRIGLLKDLISGPVTAESKARLLSQIKLGDSLPVSWDPLVNGEFESRLRLMTADERYALRTAGTTMGRTLANSAVAREQQARRLAAQQAAERLAAEHAADSAATRTLNADMMARDNAIVASNKAIEASNAKAQADYQAELARIARETSAAQAAHNAEVARTEAANAEAAARYARQRRAWEACVAGDRSQCAVN